MSKKWIFLVIVFIAIVMVFYWQFAISQESPKPAHQHAVETQEPKILYWVDPMHPSYKSDKPGIAPDCGMQLTPVYESDKPGQAPTGTVTLSARKQQLINLKLAVVTEAHIMQNIRTVGVLQYDETKVVKIHSKIDGWIEKVYANYTGRFVRKGQALFSIYSPELVATQQEYLLAVKAEKTLGNSSFPDVSSGSKALKESAYRRLKLWDVSDQQIKKLEETGTPITSVIFYSPLSGYVLSKDIFEKQRIDYQTETYSIVDLSTIWVMADVYEYEAGRVHEGQDAIMTLSYGSEEQFRGKVAYVYPELNNATRTIKARIEFANSNLALRPGMYANVELDTGHGSGLVIPVDAVLDSGKRKVVFVQVSEGEFEPREVALGQRLDENVVVTSGLNAGDKIVASGNFLIDSESELKSAFESMEKADHQHGQ